MRTRAFTVPTDAPESDGTLAWHETTMVLVEVTSGATTGIGYTYADRSAAMLVDTVLRPRIVGLGAWDIPAAWRTMVASVRNVGREGIAATAISAVDNALWDLKARLLHLPLASLLGRAHDRIPAYGSGGFTSYDDDRLARQLAGWVDAGCRFVKIKVGRDPATDPHRLEVARRAIGPDVELFVDANGAHGRRAAVAAAARYADQDVTWLEEPVSSDDHDGLRFVREHAPAGMAIAAGEYGWGPDHFRRLVDAGAVDVLQADATRCLGTTGYLLASDIAESHHVPLSAHCAPAIHSHLGVATRPTIHIEWFHDHVRLEHLLFDGAARLVDGAVTPDPGAEGFGLRLREAEAAPYLTWQST